MALTIQGQGAVPGLARFAGALGGVGNADDVGADARFQGPIGVVGDGAGNLYVVDGENQVIRRIVIATGVDRRPAESCEGQARTLPARLNGPVGLAVLRQQIFVVDQRESSVLVIR